MISRTDSLDEFESARSKRRRSKVSAESESPVAQYTFAVNYIADQPSVNGHYAVLLNPIGAAPSYTRRPGCSVTWKLWLPASKLSEWTQLTAEAKSKSEHKLFITAEWFVSDAKSVNDSTQVNNLKALTKVTKSVRPVVVVPEQDDLL